MSVAIVYSRAADGVAAPLVTVETHLAKGMVGLHIVGLPAAAVRESKDRVRSAIINSGFDFPVRKIIINLAPADLPKEGGRFDLPIALGILAASGQIPLTCLPAHEFAGELALSGALRPLRGVLPFVLAAQQAQRCLVIPTQNAEEAALVQQAAVLAAPHLSNVCAYLHAQETLSPCHAPMLMLANKVEEDFADVRGQAHAKRALEIAAAGQHSVLFVGPPGTGKTMLASRLPTILPEINDTQALEIAAIASVSGNGFLSHCWKRIPFRAPHHTSSSVALVGGGRPPKPGEISLAHQGVLFLDELPEFSRHVLECLREPLESGQITISRAAYQTIFPARFQLITAMNPCPCGYAGSTLHACRCSNEQINRYLNKLSGPLLDRIHMQVEVAQIARDALWAEQQTDAETSAQIRARVIAARQVQYTRQAKCNTVLTVPELAMFSKISSSGQLLLQTAFNKFNFSARVYHRIIKLARTIADLEQIDIVRDQHIAEALSYRCLDRKKALE